MNILYLFPSINPQKGGIERVTYVMSRYLQQHGFNCYFVGLRNKNTPPEKEMTYLPDTEKDDTAVNISFLRNYIKEHNINIVINQGGMPGSNSCNLLHQAKTNNIIAITCLHNSLLCQIRNLPVVFEKKIKEKHLSFLTPPVLNNPILKKIVLKLYACKVHKHYITLCKNNDAIVLLSESFKKDLFYICRKKFNNVYSIPNPVSFKLPTYNDNQKEKIVLYVGRINTVQKKVDLLLQIWSKICYNYQDWRLIIVGYGEELDSLKQYAKRLHLINYSFEGQQSPLEYYRKASIFAMTSSFEGFGIVLVEAMQSGVVPIAFNSYLSASDIIDNGINGFLVKPFNINDYVNKITTLIENENYRMQLSHNAIEKAQNFNIEKVGNSWINLFNHCISVH